MVDEDPAEEAQRQQTLKFARMNTRLGRDIPPDPEQERQMIPGPTVHPTAEWTAPKGVRRHPGYQDEARRKFEHRRTTEGKNEWAKRRLGKSLARVVDEMREDSVSDLMMDRHLQDEGLLPIRSDEVGPD